MPTNHKFLKKDFKNGFETHNAILDITPYNPEVLIIGSFNHGWDFNPADFFYGRGMYMWSILSNLFTHGFNNHVARRPPALVPIVEIFEICKNAKLSFADVVGGVKKHIPTRMNDQGNGYVVNDIYPWGHQRLHSDSHLIAMGNNGWLDDNVKEIIKYINRTPSLKYVYFTYKSGNWLVNKKNMIINGINNDEIVAGSIFTPSAMRFGPHLANPFHERCWSLCHCWIWNGLPHPVPVNRHNYLHFDHDWLRGKGVDPNNF